MKTQSSITIKTIGLAIFTMLFGAGNIIYPVKAGVLAGSKNCIGILGFLLTGVLLPILGLVSMILFDGDYKAFFGRIGRIPGFIAIAFCMFIIGPMLVMPRCVTVPFAMLSPLFPSVSLIAFSILFCAIAFLVTYKESKLLDILGKYMSWILIGSLGSIVVLGLYNAQTMAYQPMPTYLIFLDQVLQGFQTLDLIGALFFAYIIVRLIKLNTTPDMDSKKIALLCLKGGIVAGAFMTAFYLGFSFLGAYYAHLVNLNMNGAEIFGTIALHIIGMKASIILVVAVLMACFSTLVALAAVFSEYLRKDLFHNKISYIQSLTITLITTAIISNFGLSNILYWAEPVINFGYPIIVTIALCNAAYKLFGFTQIKIPVLLTTIAMIYIQLKSYW
ncbi:branched-chain amino acid transport system II carrier protein [Candidatus Babeliales bacterium]|nr:branched-chain amino acid transport system II carrier protein [Candidatus Babeliales bacterium]